MVKRPGRRSSRRHSSGARSSGTRDDIPKSDVDAFDASRDEILLDDNAEGDPRLDEFDGDTQEVLGMDMDDEDSDSDDQSDHNVGDEQDDEEEEDDDLDRYRTMILPSSVTESSLSLIHI